MAETLTPIYGFRKYEDYDIDWGAGVNSNMDDVELALGVVELGHRIHVQHTEPNGADGGDLGIIWTSRPMEAPEYNNISGAGVTANQLTLPAGTYLVEGFANAYSCDGHRAQLYDTTGLATLIKGSTERAKLSYLDMSSSKLSGIFVLTVESVLEWQHIAVTAKTTSGLGRQSGLDTWRELYADMVITKLA